jgi:hypothetical protein
MRWECATLNITTNRKVTFDSSGGLAASVLAGTVQRVDSMWDESVDLDKLAVPGVMLYTVREDNTVTDVRIHMTHKQAAPYKADFTIKRENAELIDGVFRGQQIMHPSFRNTLREWAEAVNKANPFPVA